MMLWDIIRDFFVEYIFGGFSSNGDLFGGVIGEIVFGDSVQNDKAFTTSMYFKFGPLAYSEGADFVNDYLYISLGDWLSTTATIITLCAICVFLFFFVRWLFRLTAGLISGRG